MKIAILALQGAFREHAQMLEKLGIEYFFVRNKEDWNRPKDGLIIPGGESTVMLRLARDLELFDPLRESILQGLPVMGTCAGLIMLDLEHLDTMNIRVRRNAYGRQLGSFTTVAPMTGIGDVEMTFIRAPYIEEAGAGVEVLSTVDGHIVAARQDRQLAISFHPELTGCAAVHRYFIETMVG